MDQNGKEKAAMMNDCFFLGFPFLCVSLLSAEHGLIIEKAQESQK